MTLNDMVPMADLLAQFSMAKSAKMMLWLTTLQLVVGVAGTIALVLTIRQAQRSQSLAEEAIQLQRDMSEKQLRAYLVVTVEKVDARSGNVTTAKVVIENQGNTPAIITQCLLDTRIHDSDNIRTANLGSYVAAIGTLGSKQKHVIMCSLFGAHTFEDIERLTTGDAPGGKVIVVRAEVTYQDIFSKEHTTHYGRVLRLHSSGKSYRIVRSIGENSI